MSERVHVESHKGAEVLSDADYLTYCQDEARKLFEALMAKRFPSLVRRKAKR